ncbi:MAG: hypothetical protein EOO61_04570 [Hymenobacter sp.]|nr:MAG: hypothetical protein EOO61_04570 [Hymenobacter sp.]
MTRSHANDFAWLLWLFLAFFDVSPFMKVSQPSYQMASFIEQKGEKTLPRGGGLFSLLSLNITFVISPLLESVRILARPAATPSMVLYRGKE